MMRYICSFSVSLFFLCALFSSGTNAQIVTIPDANFVSFLQTNYPSCIIGNQLDTQCPDVLSTTYLNLQSLDITDLTGVEHFTSLEILEADHNQLTWLPTLTGLTQLNFLNVGYNQLTTIPTLPNSLEYLVGPVNLLDSLPALPNQLMHLSVYNNNLTSLPTLPSSLANFDCSFNPLTSLPALPNSIYEIICISCQLTSLPILPQGLLTLNCNDNPLLICLPTLPDGLEDTGGPYYNQIGFQGTGISCLPNVPSGSAGTSPFPICITGDSINNPFNCPTTSGVYGYVFKDDNLNCTLNGGELLLQNIMLFLVDDLGDTVQASTTIADGSFNFGGIVDGNYTVNLDTTGIPFLLSCASPGLSIPVTITGGMAVFDINFGLKCKPGIDIGALSAIPNGWVFPGQNHDLKMHVGEIANNFGVSCASGVGGNVDITVSGPVTYLSPAPGALSPTSISGNVYSYSVADYSAIDFYNDFGLTFTTDTTALADDTICVTIVVSPNSGDLSLDNNTLNFCYPVVNSYDPNIKLVYPRVVVPNYQDWLTYTVYFQNTGSAPAFNIKLIDTLADYLVLESFQLLDYSHPIVVSRSANIVSFKFNNIILPDSASNPDGSIGYAQFRIKPRAGILDNERIDNKVYIYFDFNAPIITNDATTMFKSAKRFGGDELIPYPNPVENLIQFYLPESYLDKDATVAVYNNMGEKIVEYTFTPTGLVSFDFSNQQAGVYILIVTSENQKLSARFLKN